MRQIWISGGLAAAAAVGLWCCAIDDRSPQQVTTSNQPGDAGVPGPNATPPIPPSPTPDGDGAGGSATGGSAGSSGGAAGSSGGTPSAPPGAAGTGNAGAGNAGTTGSSAGAGGSGPMGAGGMGGSGAVDPGDPGSPPSVSSTCTAFDACGGELAGVWTYSDICTDLASSLEQLQTVCPTGSVRVDPGGASTLAFVGGQVTRQGAPLGDSVITFPPACLVTFGCSDLAALTGDSGQCSDVKGDCICRSPASVALSTQPYTTSGGQLTLQDGRSFEYCVQGDRLLYRETGMAQEPGTFTLQRN